MDFELITNELKKRKITQKKMCEDIGLESTNYSNMKNGGRSASIEVVLKVAKYLNINPAELSPEHKEYFSESLLEAYTNEHSNKYENDSLPDIKPQCYSRIKDDLLSNNRLIAMVENLLEENKRLNLLLLNEKDLRIQMLMDMKSIHN